MAVEVYAYLIEQHYGLAVRAMNLYYMGEGFAVPTCRFSYGGEPIDKTIADVDVVVGLWSAKNLPCDKYE